MKKMKTYSKLGMLLLLTVSVLFMLSSDDDEYDPDWKPSMNIEWTQIDKYHYYTELNGNRFYRERKENSFYSKVTGTTKDGLVEFEIVYGFDSFPFSHMSIKFFVDKKSSAYDKIGPMHFTPDGRKIAMMFYMPCDQRLHDQNTIKKGLQWFRLRMCMISAINISGKKDTHSYTIDEREKFWYDSKTRKLDAYIYSRYTDESYPFCGSGDYPTESWKVFINDDAYHEYYHGAIYDVYPNSIIFYNGTSIPIRINYKKCSIVLDYQSLNLYPRYYLDSETLGYVLIFSPFVSIALYSILEHEYLDLHYTIPKGIPLYSFLKPLMQKDGVINIGRINYKGAKSLIESAFTLITQIELGHPYVSYLSPMALYIMFMYGHYNKAYITWLHYKTRK